MKKSFILFVLSTIIVATTLKASEKTDSSKIYFENAFAELKSMLEGKTPPSFERAIFVSENPYWNNKYSYENFKEVIDNHLYFIEKLISANNKSDTIKFSAHVMANGKFKMDDIRYTEKEKRELYLNDLKNWAIFKYITDTIVVYPFYHSPFSYASNDPFGKKEWGNSQVLKLLASSGEHKGNCFALTGFFKILSDRLNSGAKICTAPQHIYIQHQDTKGDFYNVELATAGHPGDGMIQTLTYTTNEAIMSGIALRDYNENQSIGLCLVNLAKSYEHKFNSKDDKFLLKCAELVLKHDSLNLNALLLKQQVLDEKVISYALKHKITDVNRLKSDKGISETYAMLKAHLSKLYNLGYRQMPLYMQQMILNGFSDENSGSVYAAKNASPFTTVKPKDEKDEQYWTLSHGAFQEVFEHKKLETYGHFTFNTEMKNISAIDTTNQKGFIIDPVAFAYDFGARMYDARLGIFVSPDPHEKKYPQWSPYSAFANNPINVIDVDGRDIKAISGGDATILQSAFSKYSSLFSFTTQPGKINVGSASGEFASTHIFTTNTNASIFEKRLAASNLSEEEKANATAVFKVLSSQDILEVGIVKAADPAAPIVKSDETGRISTVSEFAGTTNPQALDLLHNPNKTTEAIQQTLTNPNETTVSGTTVGGGAFGFFPQPSNQQAVTIQNAGSTSGATTPFKGDFVGTLLINPGTTSTPSTGGSPVSNTATETQSVIESIKGTASPH